MPQTILFKAIPFDKELVTLALESGVDGVVAEPEQADVVTGLGRTRVLSEGAECRRIRLESKEAEQTAAAWLDNGETVVLEAGWEVIPVENLLARGCGNLGLEVDSLDQARLAAGILEKGADILVVLPEAADDLKPIVEELRRRQGAMSLEKAVITGIRPVGPGHRVCVDTCSLLGTGQGVLTGNSTNFTFLVQAETEANPYVSPRPFRINAGAVHAYLIRPGDTTSYLEELRAGDDLLIVDYRGESFLATAGRIKIEIRPLLLISAEADGASGGIFLQNAETIRLVRPDGSPVSVVSLAEGDEVLCRMDSAGRHFGRRIAEQLEEK